MKAKCPHCGERNTELIDKPVPRCIRDYKWWCFDCKVIFIAPNKPHKYRAEAIVADGIRFDSKAEARSYSDLKALVRCGEVQWFIRQPMFDLPGGIVYRADFLLVLAEGGVEVWDVKGYKTKEFIIKAKLFKEAYPKVKLYLITKKGREEP